MKPLQKTTGAFEKVGECLYRYKPSGVYYARIKRRGKEIRQSLETKDRALAKRRLAEKHGELEHLDPAAGKVTVEELLRRFLLTLENHDRSTVEKLKFLGERFKATWKPGLRQQVGDVRPSQVLEWLGTIRPKHSKSYYNDHVQFVRRMFALAEADRIIMRSPGAEAKTLRRDSPIRNTPTWEQFKAIVGDIRNQPFNADADASADFVEFLGLSGLGNSEAANLRWEHIDFERGKITVFRNKTDIGFQIPIYPQVRPLLERLRGTKRRSPNESVLAIKDAKKALAQSCRRLGFVSYSHRALRRCFITRCIELGLDFKTVAALQGHRDGGVLIAKTYSHLRSEHVDRMAARLTDEEPENVVRLGEQSAR
jgi:integrase